MDHRSIKLLAAVLLFSSAVVAARALEKPSQARPASRKTADTVATTPGGHSTKQIKKEAAPCSRGTWKDDPVCFGEGEQDALPLPAANSVEHNSRSLDPNIKPTANLNSRPSSPGPYQAGVVYQSNGNAVPTNYGGGVSIQLPF